MASSSIVGSVRPFGLCRFDISERYSEERYIAHSRGRRGLLWLHGAGRGGREAFLKLDDSFAAKDVAAAVAGFTQDADLTLWRSAEVERAVGPAELETFATWMAGLDGSFTIDYAEHRVTVEGPVAWVNAAGTATWDDGAGEVKHMPHRVTGSSGSSTERGGATPVTVPSPGS